MPAKIFSSLCRHSGFAFCAVGLFLFHVALTLPPLPRPAVDAVAQSFGALPLSFEANRGQTDRQVDFLARGRGYALFLKADEATLLLRHRAPGRGRQASVVKMKLRGGNSAAPGSGLEELAGKKHYFIGNDPAKWQRNVPTFARVKYPAVYPGVDLVYYGREHRLEYDFLVAPQADLTQIGLEFEGAHDLHVNEAGDLVLSLDAGEVQLHRPVAYQGETPEARQVKVRYEIASHQSVRFAVGDYDRSQPLVIDPILTYSTYLGGRSFDSGHAIATDRAGSAYMVGVSLSEDYPVTPGAFTTDTNGIVVTKLNAAGSALVYSTFLGGSNIGFADDGFAIGVNASGEAFIAGKASSIDFPVTPNAFDQTCGTDGLCNNRSDAFLSKLSADGATLLYSTYLGGNEDDAAYALTLDKNGLVYLTGLAQSTDFPLKSAFQNTCGGGFAECSDAFVAKLDTAQSGAASLVFSTYLGGNGDESGQGIAVDRRRNVYVTGSTLSTNFPVTPGALDPTCGNDGLCDDINSVSPGSDAFVSKLSSKGSRLVYSTYLGANGIDTGSAITVDNAGAAYLTGASQSTDFPTTAGAFSRTLSGIQDAYVAVLNANGSALTAATYLGGVRSEGGTGIVLDRSNKVHIVGTTDSTDFPVTPDRPFNYAGSEDAFVTKFETGLGILIHSTTVGGGADDLGSGISLSGDATFITGQTVSRGFPVTAGAFDTTCGTDGDCNDNIEDAFITKLVLPAQATLFADAELSEIFLAFPATNVGTTSAPKTSVLSSTGDGPLLIDSIVATGDFAQTNNCGSSLPPGAQCTISVTFTPTQSGNRVGQVTITDNAEDSPQIITLTGTGLSNAAVTLSPGDMNFGNVKIGTTSPPMIETVTSTGSSNVVISDVVVAPPFAQTNNCVGQTLPPGSQCTISVTYSPTANFNDSAILQLQDNTGKSNFAVMSGRGVP